MGCSSILQNFETEEFVQQICKCMKFHEFSGRNGGTFHDQNWGKRWDGPGLSRKERQAR